MLADLCYSQRAGEDWASLPKVFSTLRTWWKEESARDQLAPWLHVPCSKWSERSERLGWSQTENFTCTQQPCYFPTMWQNINYALHCRGRMGDQVWSARKDATTKRKAEKEMLSVKQNRWEVRYNADLLTTGDSEGNIPKGKLCLDRLLHWEWLIKFAEYHIPFVRATVVVSVTLKNFAHKYMPLHILMLMVCIFL